MDEKGLPLNRSFDVAVVGAGIVGLGAAYAAARRGKSVVVIDRSAEPQGATIRNFGHLCASAQTGQARVFADASRDIWLTLAEDAGFWVRDSDTHVVARHEDEIALLEAGARDGGIDVLDAAEIERRVPIRRGIALGGAAIRPHLQTDPREAGPAIRRYLAGLGVEFLLRTSVGAVAEGRVDTSRGTIHAGLVVVAVNHDIDQLLPELAESVGVRRCALDMLRARVDLRAPMTSPVLTGWSLTRYGRFEELPEVTVVRDRLHAERADLAAIDINQMYTQLPDGTLLIGDSHWKGDAVSPFQPESAMRLLVAEAEELFGASVEVIERWQGVYAKGPGPFLIREIAPGVQVLTVTTGIGMTTGLGLAELTLAPLFADTPILEGTRA